MFKQERLTNISYYKQGILPDQAVKDKNIRSL